MEIRELARQLGKAIRETPEFTRVQAARSKVEEHEAAALMLRDFRGREEAYRAALEAGKSGETEAEELKKLAAIVSSNPYIRDLFMAEAGLAELVVGLQREMMAAAGLAVPDNADEGSAAHDA